MRSRNWQSRNWQWLATLAVVSTVVSTRGFARGSVAESPELAAQAQQILEKHCFECHGKDPKKIKGDGLKILDHALLVKERKVVIPNSPDQSELLKKVEEETMPPGRRRKLTTEERKTLRDWIAAGAAPFPDKNPLAKAPQKPSEVTVVEKTPKAPLTPTGPELAGQVKELFRSRCFECHGGSKTNAGVKILDRDLLVQRKRKVVPGNLDESVLFQLITAQDDSGMPPPGQPRLSADDIDLVRNWILQGAPPFPADIAKPLETNKEPVFRDVVGVDYIHKKILEHVRSLPTEERPFIRYFSINHLLTAGATSQELDLHRDAFAKTINNLSWEKSIVRPQPIDPPANSLYFVDIRRLGWNKKPFQKWQNGRQAGPSDLTVFDLILLEYPYGAIYQDSETFDRLTEEFLVPAYQIRPILYIRADWLASVVTQPPVYEDILGLPFTLEELEERLGVNEKTNLEDYVAKRGGLIFSGVSHNNRVVERHPAKYGAFWKSFDFRSSKGQENVLLDPIHLTPAGGEMIFNLPNGLQGYFVANGKGKRVEFAPTDIVTDKFAEDKTVRNGLACMRCHDAGMKGFTDAIRPAFLRLPGSAGFDKRAILQLYPQPADMDQVLKEDGERFLGALQQALGKAQRTEPLVHVSHRFLDAPLQLTGASAELGLVSPAGLKEVLHSPALAALGLQPLAADGAIHRDMWEDYFDQIVRQLGLAVPIVPLDGLTRRDFKPYPPVDVELRTNKRGNVFEPGDDLIIFVKNKFTQDLYIELIGTSTTGRKKILPVATRRLRPGEEYRLGLEIRPEQGKEQITLFASSEQFPPGELLRGYGVSDRVVHPFYGIRRNGRRVIFDFDPARVVKKTIEIETK